MSLFMIMVIGIISGMEEVQKRSMRTTPVSTMRSLDVSVAEKKEQTSQNLSYVVPQKRHSFADESDESDSDEKKVVGEGQLPHHNECGRSMLRYIMPHRVGAHHAIRRVFDKKRTDPNSRDIHQWTPLHTATSRGSVSMVRWCLRHGADVNARNDIGQTPVHIAVLAKNLQILELLLDAKDVDVDARDGDGLTPLHVALFNQRSDEADLLWEDGADLWAETSDGYIPLDIAVSNSPNMVGVLLTRMGKALGLPQEWTYLHTVAYLGNEAAIKFLVNNIGMNLFVADSNGRIPSDVACDEAIKQLLIELQIDSLSLTSEPSSGVQTPVIAVTNPAN